MNGTFGKYFLDATPNNTVKTPVAVTQGLMTYLDCQLAPSLDERCLCGDRDAEKRLDLRGRDKYRRAGAEADDHRMGNEIHQCAEARDAHRQLEYAREQRDGQDQADVLRAAGRSEMRKACE
jgi:hypothetical protein